MHAYTHTDQDIDMAAPRRAKQVYSVWEDSAGLKPSGFGAAN